MQVFVSSQYLYVWVTPYAHICGSTCSPQYSASLTCELNLPVLWSYCINNWVDNYINLNVLGLLLLCYLWHAASWMCVQSTHPLKCLCLSSLFCHPSTLQAHTHSPTTLNSSHSSRLFITSLFTFLSILQKTYCNYVLYDTVNLCFPSLYFVFCFFFTTILVTTHITHIHLITFFILSVSPLPL